MNKDFRGDFLGFTFNGIHSSELNIVRVLEGDRDVKSLFPTIKNNTIDIPGKDGSYFFTANYGTLTKNVKFAYDDLRETDIETIRKLYSKNTIGEIIFDEEPYKKYLGKLSGDAKLSYICFDANQLDEHGVTQRIYRGDGLFQFVCFESFAESKYKSLEEYYVTEIDGLHYDENGVCVEEWAAASGMLENLNDYDVFTQVNSMQIAKVYNPSVLNTSCSFIIQPVTIGYADIQYILDGDIIGRMIIDTSKLELNKYYQINSKTKLIEEVEINNGEIINLYKVFNNSIKAGDFFNIVPSTSNSHEISINDIGVVLGSNLKYNYTYL